MIDVINIYTALLTRFYSITCFERGSANDKGAGVYSVERYVLGAFLTKPFMTTAMLYTLANLELRL
jgi:hypothetical protein